jgi:DNA-binding NarL/FixJ family response regulator
MAISHAESDGTAPQVLVVVVDGPEADRRGTLLTLSQLLPGARLVTVGGAADRDAASTLTLRECEVAGLLMQGLSNKEIAARLYIEVATVKNHVHHILGKLHVRRRGEAVARLAAGNG